LQFSTAFIGAGFREVLGGHLAPGYAHVTHNLPAILELIEKRLGPPPRRGDYLRQRARLLQSEAQAYTRRLSTAEGHIQDGYVQRHTCQTRIAQHQAQIQALKARIQRLPKRGRQFKQQVAAHQNQIQRARLREQRHQDQIEHWQQRAGQARQEAELLREARHNLIALAETPVSVGQVRLIVLRADSGLGSGETITVMLERGYLLVVKGRDARTARKLAGSILASEWERVDVHLRAAEAKSTRVTGCPFDVRLVVCERTAARGRVSFYVLVTNLPRSTYSTVALVAFYNARQTIEAFNKVIGNVLSLDHLRTGSITANEAVAQLAMLAHNFLSWSTQRFFAGTPYAGMAIRELVQKRLHVLARISWPQPNTCRTELALDNPHARTFVAGAQGSNGQLTIPLDLGQKSTSAKTA
jgi:hypothetical protein